MRPNCSDAVNALSHSESLRSHGSLQSLAEGKSEKDLGQGNKAMNLAIVLGKKMEKRV